jgi:hypothetical protein
MKNFQKIYFLSTLLVLFISITSCKTNQPMFAGAVFSGWILLGISIILMIVVIKKFI